MPVIVVGADTDIGEAIVRGLIEREGEVRAFVTDPAIAARLRDLGVKVALGDVSDGSHVSAACTNAFSAVLVAEAAADDRERSFGCRPETVLTGWADAIRESGVQRTIWVLKGEPPPATTPEHAVVDALGDTQAIVTKVVALDDARQI